MNKIVIGTQRIQASAGGLLAPVLSRLCIWLFVGVCLAGMSLTTNGASFKRKGGDPILGEVLSVSDKGIVFKTSEGRLTARIPFAELEESEIAGDAKVKAFRDTQAAKEKLPAGKNLPPPVVPLGVDPITGLRIMDGLPGTSGRAMSVAPAAPKTFWKAKDGVPGEVETKYSFLDVREDCKKLVGKTIKLPLWVFSGSHLGRADGEPTPAYDGYFGSARDGMQSGEEAGGTIRACLQMRLCEFVRSCGSRSRKCA